MERIVVGLDSGRAAESAVAWAIDRARQKRAHLTLVSALGSITHDSSEMTERLETVARSIRTRVAFTRVDIEVISGTPLDALEAYARQTDVIVVGSPGVRPASTWTTSRLPIRVAARADCPVVIVPEGWRPVNGRIVVGLATDTSSDEAVRYAAADAKARERDLSIVHAWGPLPAGSDADKAGSTSSPLRAAHQHRLAIVGDMIRGVHPGLSVDEKLASEASLGCAHRGVTGCRDDSDRLASTRCTVRARTRFRRVPTTPSEHPADLDRAAGRS